MRRATRGHPSYAGAVNSTPRAFAAAAAAALLLALAACSTTPATSTSASASPAGSTSEIKTGPCDDDTGVTIVVDGSALEGSTVEEFCVTTDEAIGAADALSIAAVQTEGTEEYGDQVVCRVNGAPAEDLALTAEDGSEYFETCASMPAAFAYWSLWVQPAGGEWAYAEEGLSTLQLEPGESIALLFTLNGEPAAPTS
jgi:hypothetical protein